MIGWLLRRLIARRVGDKTDADPRAALFVRGLAFGALVGAAIVGSGLLRRRN